MRENFEPDIYREDLAKEMKRTPKQERKEVLEEVKKTPEYWKARGTKLEGRQEEEKVDDSLGVFIKKRTLFHGTTIKGIKDFLKAEETTVGEGVYLTSQAKDAVGYAYRRKANRSNRENRQRVKPVVYEVSVENLRLADLRKDKNVKILLRGLLPILEEKSKSKDIKYYRQNALVEAYGLIFSGKIGRGNVSEAIAPIGQVFTDYMQSLGYDGLITYEGGEGKEVGNHDTYLIFDPEKVKVGREQEIKEKDLEEKE